MFDQLRSKPRRAKTPTTSDPVADACQVLLVAARETTWPRHRDEQLMLLRKARSHTHPDLGGGREAWDRVEAAAKFLKLHKR